MSFSIKYVPLFEVQILHRFFLNKGSDDYFAMTQIDREKQLAGYSVSNFLEIFPTARSRIKLAGHRMAFTTSGTGFSVWIQVDEANYTEPMVELAEDLELSFLLKLLNHTFYNYTDLPFSSAGKLFFFGNMRPSSESVSFPLIELGGSQSATGDSFVLSEKDRETALEEIGIKDRTDLFGLVKIRMKGENATLNITDSPDKLRNQAPVFEILFENRKTYWRYFFNSELKVKPHDPVDKENGNARQLVTKDAYPLTSRGFIKIEVDGAELPNPDERMIKPGTNDNKIYSEIYM